MDRSLQGQFVIREGRLSRAPKIGRIRLRPITPGLCAQMIQLHRAVFPPEQVDCTIYGASGVRRYLASLVRFPQYQTEHMFWGVWDGCMLLGYAHFRALPESWHLNNIAVHPDAQQRGIGSRLWEQFVLTGRQRSCRRLTLDVELDNRVAIAWYESRGLQPDGMVWRYEKQMDSTCRGGEVVQLLSWEQAEAWQMAYGFSQFQVQYAGQLWTIGRLGDRYYRSTTPLPTAVEALLARIDPSRRLLIFSPHTLSGPQYIEKGVSVHMSGPIG